MIVIPLKTWFHEEYLKQAPFEKSIHVTTTVIVFVNLILKIISLILSFFYDPKIKQTF